MSASEVACRWRRPNTTDGSPPSMSSIAPKILIRSPRNWYQVFYIRMNRGESFCMYPNLGGPFQSIDEADDAIDRYLDELWHRAIHGNVSRFLNCF